MKLVSQNYGKQRVRVLKVLRSEPRHEVKIIEFGIRLEGDFDSSYTAGDNRSVVPTDTMKNAVHALAHQHVGSQTEPFAVLLTDHFLTQYPQGQRVTTMPNKHYLPARLEPFGPDGTGVSFVPTDEPHGQIEAVIPRDEHFS